MRKSLAIALIVIGIFMTRDAVAQQHDHQDWNLISIGRVVTLARTNTCIEEGTPEFACGVDASHRAVAKMEELLETVGCTSYGDDTMPKITPAVPFSRHDHGPVIVAELRGVRCTTLPSTQFLPVDPEMFKQRCSRLEWKCDAVWISDSDPTVWYMGVLNDIPRDPS